MKKKYKFWLLLFPLWSILSLGGGILLFIHLDSIGIRVPSSAGLTLGLLWVLGLLVLDGWLIDYLFD